MNKHFSLFSCNPYSFNPCNTFWSAYGLSASLLPVTSILSIYTVSPCKSCRIFSMFCWKIAGLEATPMGSLLN